MARRLYSGQTIPLFFYFVATVHCFVLLHNAADISYILAIQNGSTGCVIFRWLDLSKHKLLLWESLEYQRRSDRGHDNFENYLILRELSEC